MNKPLSLQSRLLEILLEVPPQERKLLVEELKQVIWIISSDEKKIIFEPQLPPLPLMLRSEMSQNRISEN